MTDDYIEQPLTYGEARRGVWKFEHEHKVSSAALFAGKCDGANINPDVLFEWKSFYDFVCEVDRRVASALADRHQRGLCGCAEPVMKTWHERAIAFLSDLFYS